MVTEQNERLSKLVRTLLDMSELQTVARNDKIELCGDVYKRQDFSKIYT